MEVLPQTPKEGSLASRRSNRCLPDADPPSARIKPQVIADFLEDSRGSRYLELAILLDLAPFRIYGRKETLYMEWPLRKTARRHIEGIFPESPKAFSGGDKKAAVKQ